MEIKVQIPSELNEINVQQYARYLDIVEQHEKMQQKSEKKTNIFYLLKTLEIFTGIKYEDGLSLRLSDVRRIVVKIEKLLSEKPDLTKIFELGNVEFGFIPKLDDMTFGEYVDLDTNIGNWNDMHKAMAVLYRPVIKRNKDKYLIEEYRGDSYHEAMKVMPLGIAFGALIFFYHLGRDLSIGMTKFLEKTKTQESMPSQIFQENTVGIKASIVSLRETLQDMRL